MELRKEIDPNVIIDLASKGMIQEEIAARQGISVDTLHRHFAEEYKIGCRLRNGSIRQKQVELALAGNTTMLVWLGKNLLNQTDRSEIKVVEELGFGDFAEAVVAGADKADATAARVH